MTPIENLNILIKEMTPELVEQKLYFCTTKDEALANHLSAHSFATIRESEGITLVLPEGMAAKVEDKEPGAFARIELKVFSSLEAVGLTAAFSQYLKQVGISANVIAGFYHDHILVPWDVRQKAITALQDLSNNSL